MGMELWVVAVLVEEDLENVEVAFVETVP